MESRQQFSVHCLELESGANVDAAQVSLLFDTTNGNHWDLSLTANEVEAAQIDLTRAQITGQGTLDQSSGLGGDGELQGVGGGMWLCFELYYIVFVRSISHALLRSPVLPPSLSIQTAPSSSEINSAFCPCYNSNR